MGDLHHIDRADAPGREELLLRSLPQIAQEEAGQPRPLGADHNAPVVSGRRVARACWRPDHPPAKRTECPRHACTSKVHPNALVDQRGVHPFVGCAIGRPDQRSVDAIHRTGEPADVVGVEMRQDQQVDPGDPERVEAGRSGLRRASDVDHRDRASVAQEERIALADVAGGDLPVARHADGSRDDPSSQGPCIRPDSDRECEGRAARQHRGEAMPHGQHRHGSQNARAQQHADHALHPRQCRTRERRGGVGDLRDPRRRQPGQAHEQLPERGRPREGETRQTTEHRGERRGRFGEKVRSHAVERDGRREEDQNGLARQLRRRRDRDGEGDTARHPAAEDARQRAGEEQEPGRRGHGQGEPVVARHPRVVHEQHHDRERQGRHAVRRPPSGERDQNDQGHRRGPQDAGPGPDQHDERKQRGGGDDDSEPPTGTEAGGDEEHQSGDERAVCAGDGREVAQRAGLHRRVELGRHRGLVADREPGEQRTPVTG